jgi:hypothetical protein
MVNVPPSVNSALITFFQGQCPNPSLVTKTANVYHLCCYDQGGGAWRGVCPAINALPAMLAANLWLASATLMDSCVSIADIEGKLTTRTAPTGVAAAMKKGKPKAKAKKKKVPKTGAAKGKKPATRKPNR